MRTRAERRVAARYRWDRLKVSFWFASAIMALAAVLLAWFMYWLDGRIPNEALQSSRFVLSGTVGEMRSALLNIAGTVLATAGVVFTLLTLPLSTVAAQYGSRLLRFSWAIAPPSSCWACLWLHLSIASRPLFPFLRST